MYLYETFNWSDKDKVIFSYYNFEKISRTYNAPNNYLSN